MWENSFLCSILWIIILNFIQILLENVSKRTPLYAFKREYLEKETSSLIG